MANNNNGEVEVKRTSYSMIDLGNLPDDELRETNLLTVYNGGPILENQPLSQRIGVCRNMTKLCVVNCASLPYVMKHVYHKTDEDPTSVFTLLREGPIVRRYKFEKTPLLFVNDKKDDSDDEDVDGDDIDDNDYFF